MAAKQGYVCEKQGYANSSSRGQEGAQDLATAGSKEEQIAEERGDWHRPPMEGGGVNRAGASASAAKSRRFFLL